MSYFVKNYEQLRIEKIQARLDSLSLDPSFAHVLTQMNHDQKTMMGRLQDVLPSIAAILGLSSEYDNKYYYYSSIPEKRFDPDQCQFSHEESKFIKRCSAMYLYFRQQRESKSTVENIVASGMVEDFFLDCFLFGYVSVEHAKDLTITKLSDKQLNRLYEKSIAWALTQETSTALGGKKFIKNFIKQTAAQTLLLESFPYKINFFQKQAIYTLGYKYVGIGRSFRLLSDNPELLKR